MKIDTEELLDGIVLDQYQISDFTNLINERIKTEFPNVAKDMHQNTYNDWFKKMEEQGVHYVNRMHGEKVYEQLDLEIAVAFYKLRKITNLKVDVIISQIGKYVKTRKFTDLYQEKFDVPQEYKELVGIIKQDLIEDFKALILETKEELNKDYQLKIELLEKERRKNLEYNMEIEKKSQENVTEFMDEIKKNFNERLEKELELVHRSKYEDREIRLQELVLRKEALIEWNKLDESIRMISSGFLKMIKREDIEKKEKFMNDYIAERLEKYVTTALEKYDDD